MGSRGDSITELRGHLIICPVGPSDMPLLHRLGEAIRGTCGMVCEVVEVLDLPRQALDRGRGQYDCHAILKSLLKVESNCLRFMGVTEADLFIQALRYVYGVSQVDGRCSIISAHRLFPEFYNEAPDRGLLLQRLTKTAIHELGHSMGLTHCRERRCVMYSSIRIADTDFKGTCFCPTCSELFRWNLERCLDCRTFRQ